MDELDRVTLARAQKGDHQAFRRLIECYQRPVHALLGRMLIGRRALVDDLAQETFLRVYKALPGFDPDGPARLSSWVLTIATRLAIDTLRKPRLVDAGESAIFDLPAPDDPEAQVSGRLLEARLLKAMAELPPDHRAVLLLRAFHDLDYPEIGVALDLEVGTVKSRLSRARAALSGLLEEGHV